MAAAELAHCAHGPQERLLVDTKLVARKPAWPWLGVTMNQANNQIMEQCVRARNRCQISVPTFSLRCSLPCMQSLLGSRRARRMCGAACLAAGAQRASCATILCGSTLWARPAATRSINGSLLSQSGRGVYAEPAAHSQALTQLDVPSGWHERDERLLWFKLLHLAGKACSFEVSQAVLRCK